MPRQARQASGTGIYHVMMRGINHQNIFEEQEDYYQFLNKKDCFLICHDLSHVMKQEPVPVVQTVTSRIGQLPHQESANCHIKNRPTATFIVKKVAEFEI